MQRAPKSTKTFDRSRYNPQLLSYVTLLRFGSSEHPDFARPVLNYQTIARVLGRPVTTVVELVRLGMRTYSHGFQVDPLRRSKLTQQHIGYLVAPSTLQESAHLSLAERAELFHRRFGEVKVSPSTIRRIYLRHKIRFKNIKRGKREIDFSEPHYK